MLQKLIIFATTYLLVYCSLHKYLQVISRNERIEIDRWMHESGLDTYKNILKSNGFDKLVHLATIENLPQLTVTEEDHVKRASTSLKERLILSQWLKSLGIYPYFFRLSKEEVNSLEDVYFLDDAKAHEILGKDFAAWTRGRQMLPSTKEALDTFKLDLWENFVSSERSMKTIEVLCFCGCVLIIAISSALLLMLFYKDQIWFAMRSDTSILHVITGRYLDAGMCKIQFDWSDPCPVGETMSFVIKFFQRNGMPYPVCDKDDVQIEITFGVRKISSVVSLGGTTPEDANTGNIKFSVRSAGEYKVNVMVRNEPIPGSPFKKWFLPGPVDPTKTKFERHSSIVICCPNVVCTLMIQPRDSFHNLCLTCSSVEISNYVDLELYHSVVKQGDEEKLDVCYQFFNWDKTSSNISFELMFLKEGYYQVQVFYRDVLLLNGDFTCIVLCRAEYDLTNRKVKNRGLSYEGKLTRIEGEPPFKPKRVTMYISPKQFTVKEFVLKFLLKRVATFRLCPSTKIQLLEETANGVPCFSVDDGCQPTIYLAAHNRNVIAATFTKFLLNNIGGSETFNEKEYFLYYEVRRIHHKYEHDPITLKIDRQKLLKSSFNATKHFTLKEWCSRFEVIFVGEEGVDWGGLRKEWFQLTCDALFNPSNNLFRRFGDNPQALVHPNKNRAPHLKLKYFEFAGRLLGKCLYESALGGSYSQFVNAKFTRSFLAQLIGLRINYHYFLYDDPDLYISKIKYILDNDVTGMDLFFVDEEYDDTGQLVKVVELITNGNKIKVTNRSKRHYADRLAQYRLATSVKDEIESFVKGLNEIIPDNLLCIFDENELELLLCGTGEYSVSDLRDHHIVNRLDQPPFDFDRVLKWFWIAVSNFSTEEMARLLQFTTGSSQLPPGGFGDLNPMFQIMPAPLHGNLPTAHTCFNQLCLPDYDSYEQFEKSLLLAINEGAVGFGLV